MARLITRVTGWLVHQVWERDAAELPWMQRKLLRAVRVAVAVVRDLSEGMLPVRAMAMVYITILALVPLLALSFSVLKAFGVHTRLAPMLEAFFAPLGPRGPELADQIVTFVADVDVGVLGALGVLVLVYTVVSLLHRVEERFNAIWRISQTRPMLQRLAGYISVILVGPVLVLTALGLTAALFDNRIVSAVSDVEPFGTTLYVLGLLVPYALVVFAFTLAYGLLPNVRVRFSAAFTGALVAGVAWKLVGVGFAEAAAGSTRYDAIYSGFAMGILALLWLYLSWLILLIGAAIAFYVQYPDRTVQARQSEALAGGEPETLGLAIMYRIARAFFEGRMGEGRNELAQHLEVPGDTLEPVLHGLFAHGLVCELADGAGTLWPARDPGAITLRAIIEAARHPDPEAAEAPAEHVPPVVRMREALEEAMAAVAGERTLRDLAEEA